MLATSFRLEEGAKELLSWEPGDLVVQVRGGTRDGQLLRVEGQKCLIGSSNSCRLRIPDLDVRPVQCLVLRGPGGTIVRNFATSTRLNGRFFSDAALRTGDRLQFGPVEIEVVSEAEGEAFLDAEASLSAPDFPPLSAGCDSFASTAALTPDEQPRLLCSVESPDPAADLTPPGPLSAAPAAPDEIESPTAESSVEETGASQDEDPAAASSKVTLDEAASDEELQEYIRRLLERVGGQASRREPADAPAASDSQRASEFEAAAAPSPIPEPAEVDDELAEPAGTPAESTRGEEVAAAEMLPPGGSAWHTDTDERVRQTAPNAASPPNGTVDIQAMRELANSAARLAIMEFEWKQDARIASDKVLVMLVGLPCGLLMLYWSLGRTLAGAMIGATMAFFVVVVWGVQTLRVLFKLARNRLARNRIRRQVAGLRTTR